MMQQTDAAAVTLGMGEYTYYVQERWAKLPAGWVLGDVSSIGIDARDHVYVFNRGDHPVMVFDRHGNFLRAWGEGWFRRAHGIHVGHDGFVYVTDDHAHFVRKCTTDGRILLEIGTPGIASPYMSGVPFNRCTQTALSPAGDIYVADGYGNSRVHKYAPNGSLLASWGAPGCDPGQFQIVHSIGCDEDGWVYVADRENHRVQVFDADGRYEAQWHSLHRPCGLFIAPGPSRLCYVGEIGPVMPTTRRIPNLGPRISITDREGTILARLGDLHAGAAPHQFIAPHGVAADSHGDIYVGECAYTDWPRLFPNEARPDTLITLRKLVKVIP